MARALCPGTERPLSLIRPFGPPSPRGRRENGAARGRRFLRKQAGISLIELIVFILVVSIAVTAVLSVMSTTVAHSADSLERKQAIAIAEGLLEEVLAQPFTWCDPDDANLATATTAADCATTAEAVGPETGESRYGPSYFDNVNDYQGYADSVRTPDGAAVAGLADFSVSVAVGQAGGDFGVSADAGLKVDVQVARAGTVLLTLSGYRFRHSPNQGG